MALFVGLLVLGWSSVESEGTPNAFCCGRSCRCWPPSCVRSGIVPVHCWMTDLFEHATFGTALLFAAPIAGAYAAVRLVLPIAPGLGLARHRFISLVTAVYAAGMALVQREARGGSFATCSSAIPRWCWRDWNW